ncbi:MAG: hypothetical protein OXN17_13085 [Candidatus Poribacteria bacterium]|nr:hypothetical protein [Candidatus Poribacteria bacterium]MDE0502818.1 hypothetical protein [Candidatus Poribacteria bacterium]
MKVITARLVDSTNLELSVPISVQPGKPIHISIANEDEDENSWREAAKKHLLAAYYDGDAIYDELRVWGNCAS